MLQNFPALGRTPHNYLSALKKIEHLINKEALPQTELELRKLIIDEFLILYGISNDITILFIKHHAQKDYFFFLNQKSFNFFVVWKH